MLLVRDSMTREVLTVVPETTAAEALALCRENRIRHLPVLEGERLAGVVSDRDLRAATPALGDPARAEALRSIKVADEMVRDVTTARPEDPVEDAAMAMYEKKIGCLPVVGEGDSLVGIVTSSDVLRAFVRLAGAHEPGSRIEVVLPTRSGSLAEAIGVVRDEGVDLVSVLASSEHEDEDDKRVAVLRVATIDPKGVVEGLGDAGYRVLWPPNESGSGGA